MDLFIYDRDLRHERVNLIMTNASTIKKHANRFRKFQGFIDFMDRTYLEGIPKPLTEWVKNNMMKLNHDQCYLILNDKDIKTINVSNFTIKSTKSKNTVTIYF